MGWVRRPVWSHYLSVRVVWLHGHSGWDRLTRLQDSMASALVHDHWFGLPLVVLGRWAHGDAEQRWL